MELMRKQKDIYVSGRYSPRFIHHRQPNVISSIGQIVFGLQDGMVSTLGAVTGVAIGSGEPYFVLLAGTAIVAVESVSMGIGAYISSRSEKKVAEHMRAEELKEIHEYPMEEYKELESFFIRDGWPEGIAKRMALTAKEDPDLMLTEMSYRELGISLKEIGHPVRNGLLMLVAYIIGGLIPLSAYFFLPMTVAIGISISVTLAGLFIVGAGLTRYTKQPWLQNGIHMLAFGGAALLVGLTVGIVMRVLFGV